MPPPPPDPARVALAKKLVLEDGVPLAVAARELGIPRGTLQGWQRANWWDDVHEKQADFTPPIILDHDPDAQLRTSSSRAQAGPSGAQTGSQRVSREWMRFKTEIRCKPFAHRASLATRTSMIWECNWDRC